MPLYFLHWQSCLPVNKYFTSLYQSRVVFLSLLHWLQLLRNVESGGENRYLYLVLILVWKRSFVFCIRDTSNIFKELFFIKLKKFLAIPSWLSGIIYWVLPNNLRWLHANYVMNYIDWSGNSRTTLNS